MKRLIALTVLLSYVALAGGCCSYMVMEGSKKRVALRKATIAGDQVAIKAIRLGSDGVGIGIDVTNLEALKERPLLQIGAAILDAGIVYGMYEGLAAIDDDNKDEDDGNGINIDVQNSSDVDVNIVNGDNNTSNNDREAAGDEGSSNDIE